MKLKLNITETIGYIIILMILTVSFSLSIYNLNYFDTVFSAEDGFIEWSTAIFLFLSSILLFFRFFKLFSTKPLFWKFGTIFLAILFLFAAGEEISWGQRLFEIQSNNFFIENNLQSETNLHNLKIGDYNINKIIFGKLIVIILILYLIFLPILHAKNSKIKFLLDRFAIPIVKWHHTIAFIISTLVILIITADRKWEVYEFCFAFIFFLIFYCPKNIYIYQK